MINERIITFGEAIKEGLQESIARDDSVFLMGQGIDDPSSVWGTTKGIAEKFGANKVIEMPVAENGLTGICIGAAMNGQRPVINLHRVEFALLAIEQIANNAAKSHYVSNGQHKVPIVIRMVVGRGWGQGPEHSQSLEPIFAQFPGLKVVMPTLAQDAKGMLVAAIEDDNPVIFIEHRWLHNASGHVPDGYYKMPLDGPRIIRAGEDITIVSTSYMTLEAMRAADALSDIGVSAGVIDLRVIRPLNLEPVRAAVRETGHLITVDTGWRMFGIGAEIVAAIVGDCFSDLKSAPVRLGLPDHPTPSSRGLLPGFYPDAQSIVATAGEMLNISPRNLASAASALSKQRDGLPIDVPDPFFKGPF
jgi:pyruvate/2-oxoglutarate/acetoin dehydrogenase E1 component